MPAIKNHRPVRARIPVPAARRTGEFPPFFEGFATATAERRFSVAIAHGELVSRGPEYGNLGRLRAHLAACVGCLCHPASPINAPVAAGSKRPFGLSVIDVPG